MSKLNQARKIYKTGLQLNNPRSRKKTIQLFLKHIPLSENAASTYYNICRKEYLT